ncbi:MAG: hypothetical protein K2H96_04665 [Muribaculaceae bacterium]|nr:hypothetical protein [Muribaculaceae bacterium]
MCKIKYSIIYAVIRPQIKERISVGLIIIDGSHIDIRYSNRKLAALKYLYTESELNFVTDVVRSINKDGTIKTISDIEYLSRYSNNLISFSSVETMDLDATKENKDWLFNSYVGEN